MFCAFLYYIRIRFYTVIKLFKNMLIYEKKTELFPHPIIAEFILYEVERGKRERDCLPRLNLNYLKRIKTLYFLC